MYLLKKPAFVSPSIPKDLLNFEGKKQLKNNKFQSGISDEWTDLESTNKGPSDEWTNLESTKEDSFQFNNSAPLAVSTPNSLFVQDEKDMLLEGAKYWSIFEGSFEKESSNNSCGTQKEIHAAKIPKKRSKLLKRKQQYSGFLVSDKKPKCTMAIQSTDEEWTDVEDDTIKGSSSEYSPVEKTRFADSFDFNNGTSLAVSTPLPSFAPDERGMSPGVLRKVWRSYEKRSFYKSSCVSEKDPESSLEENQRKSSSDFSPVDQVSIADLEDFECFPFDEPFKVSSPICKKPSFLNQKNEILPEAAKYQRSCKKVLEKEFSKSSSATQKETESLFDENKRDVSETAKHRSSFERSFVKKPSKNSCGTQKEMYTASVKKRWPKLKKRKLQYSGSLLVDNTLERSKDTSKQVSKIEPTNNVLSQYHICPLGFGIDCAPGPVRASSPPFFGFDEPIDDIYFLCNGSKLKSKKLETKHYRQHKSRKK